ncbi:hypothetical protein ACQ4LE_009761 [Meloidogyne hapla]
MKNQNYFLNIIFIQLFIYFCESNNYETTTEGENVWACGKDDFTEEISKSTIKLTCSRRESLINNCCINHDSCYDEQKGRDNCDNNFCGCLKNVTSGNVKCTDDGIAFCDLVKLFGGPAYKASGTHKSTSTISNNEENCE